MEAVPTRIPAPNRSTPHKASRGSSRRRYAPTTSPSASFEVMSFAEWTATSMRPPSSASSISFTNTPRAPISPKGFVRSRSPAVVMGTSVISRPRRLSCSAASSAWVSASLLPLDPILSSTVAQPEQMPDRVGVHAAVRSGGRFFQPYCREMQELVDDLRGERLDRPALPLGQPFQPALIPPQLERTDLLGARVQGSDCRHDVQRGLPGAETLRFLRRDLLGTRSFAPPAGERPRHDILLDHELGRAGGRDDHVCAPELVFHPLERE